ncbi:unnamed protein product [Urochloa humidicola]
MQWKADVINDIFRPPDAQQILGIRLPSKPMGDFVAWFYEKSGTFSVKSAYKLAKSIYDEEKGAVQQNSVHQDHRPLWKDFWKIPIPHKILNFGWKLIHNGLATRESKRRRSIVVESGCQVCGTEFESAMHAVIRCNHAKFLRMAMREVWSLPEEEQLCVQTPESLLPLIINLGVDDGAKLLLLLWRTWQVRNNITHEIEKLSFESSMRFLTKYWEELCTVPPYTDV